MRRYNTGDQIWYMDRSHCQYLGACPVMSPSVQTGMIVTVLLGGAHYSTSDGHILGADNVFATPEAARDAIPAVLEEKIAAVKARLAELETMLEREKSHGR